MEKMEKCSAVKAERKKVDVCHKFIDSVSELPKSNKKKGKIMIHSSAMTQGCAAASNTNQGAIVPARRAPQVLCTT